MSTTEHTLPVDPDALRAEVRAKYRQVALDPDAEHHFHTGRKLATHLGYPTEWVDDVPDRTVESFAGIANPFALHRPEPGDRVVDIGSGAGLDALIAAQAVGPAGHVIGVEMTEAMLDNARAGAAAAGLETVEYRTGFSESLPISDAGRIW